MNQVLTLRVSNELTFFAEFSDKKARRRMSGGSSDGGNHVPALADGVVLFIPDARAFGEAVLDVQMLLLAGGKIPF